MFYQFFDLFQCKHFVHLSAVRLRVNWKKAAKIVSDSPVFFKRESKIPLAAFYFWEVPILIGIRRGILEYSFKNFFEKQKRPEQDELLLEESHVWSHKNPEIGSKKKNAQQVRGCSLQSQRILRLGKP